MTDQTALTPWTQVLRRSFGIPDIVSESTATAALHGWIYDQLESSNLIDSDKTKAAKTTLKAVLAVAESGGLDYYVLGEIGPHLRAIPTDVSTGSHSQSGILATRVLARLQTAKRSSTSWGSWRTG